MENILISYMNSRLLGKDFQQPCRKRGPVITISRETGCPGDSVAANLERELNKLNFCDGKGHWKTISREILEESAKELNLHPDKIRYVFESGHKSTMDEIVGALSSRYYKSDRIIRKTIADVILSIANRGFMIVLGRGGVSLLQESASALHVRLYAPMEWRVGRIMELKNLSKKEAEAYIKDSDLKREELIRTFIKGSKKTVAFDLSIDCSRISEEETSAAIISILLCRKDQYERLGSDFITV